MLCNNIPPHFLRIYPSVGEDIEVAPPLFHPSLHQRPTCSTCHDWPCKMTRQWKSLERCESRNCFFAMANVVWHPWLVNDWQSCSSQPWDVELGSVGKDHEYWQNCATLGISESADREANWSARVCCGPVMERRARDCDLADEYFLYQASRQI